MEIKGLMAGIILLGLVAAVVVMAAVKPDNYFTMSPAKDVLTVSGESTVTTAPDKAELYVNVETKAEAADAARGENARVSSAVSAALRSAGLGKDEIETASYNIYPQQRYDEETQEYITTGYIARNVFKISTKKLDGLGNYIDTAVAAGANSVDSINFVLSAEKKQEVDREALAKAAGIAKTRAEAMADAAGVNLEKLVSVEGGSSYAPYMYYRDSGAMSAKAESVPTEISPQSLEVRATSTLVYQISQ
ncbi:MAG TPA: SIMPL domain-containing protein [Nanoarchaeota archaeon]|nr:SIMPL domain-containing protein [Nanoarchaeota archaeon]